MEIKDKIFNEIKKGNLKNKSLNEILTLFPYYKKVKKQTVTALSELERENKIVRSRNGKYFTPKQIGAFYGLLHGNERGFAFITPENAVGDFFVPKKSLAGALDGDRVLAAPVKEGLDEAYVIKVCERGRKSVVGTFKRYGAHGKVYPDDLKMPVVEIYGSIPSTAKDGYKVLCEILTYRESGLTGRISEVLGEGGSFEAEELSIIRAHGLSESFPDEVISEAEKAEKKPILCEGRTDLRDLLLFTVDGADTRDIDDAISLEINEDRYILGVHIADVSNYVKEKTKLDKEAYARGTSVYFPDRVLPMLPKQLSNGICSLNEGEDRLALSCLMVFDRGGNRLSYDIFESVIKSAHKTTYAEIEAILNGDINMIEKYPDLVDTVKLMDELMVILENKRKADGEVDLNVKEAKIYVDDDGEIIIPRFERLNSEKIIEQFMVSANEAVAEFLTLKKAPCLYRVHEIPAPEKAETFQNFLNDLGICANFDIGDVKPEDFQKILDAAANEPYASVISKVMLRSMQKARYFEKNLGHFGLASDCYCHFTSPIRRYPDLFVHRAVKSVLKNDYKALKRLSSAAGDAGKDCSLRERIADEAERDVDNLYKLVYMQDRLGEKFDAVISGVTNFGIFCELENTVEGLVPLESLPQDDYEYIPEKFILKGYKHSFRLGDKVRVEAASCDYGRMRVIFILENQTN